MMVIQITTGVLGVLLTASLTCAACEIKIDSPKTESSVDHRPIVKGIVTDPAQKQLKGTLEGAQVWIVVHPKQIQDYWVQPAVTTHTEGAWSTAIYIGRPGTVDIGKGFEVRAITNPHEKLQEGDVQA